MKNSFFDRISPAIFVSIPVTFGFAVGDIFFSGQMPVWFNQIYWFIYLVVIIFIFWQTKTSKRLGKVRVHA